MSDEDIVRTLLYNVSREVHSEEEWKEPLRLNKESWKKILDYIIKLEMANDNLEVEYIEKSNLINQLKEWLKNTIDESKFYGLYEKGNTLDYVLAKINELEGENE